MMEKFKKLLENKNMNSQNNKLDNDFSFFDNLKKNMGKDNKELKSPSTEKLSNKYKENLTKKELKKLKKKQPSTLFKIGYVFASLGWSFIVFLSIVVLTISFAGPSIGISIAEKNGLISELPNNPTTAEKVFHKTIDDCKSSTLNGCVKIVESNIIDDIFTPTVSTFLTGGSFIWDESNTFQGINPYLSELEDSFNYDGTGSDTSMGWIFTSNESIEEINDDISTTLDVDVEAILDFSGGPLIDFLNYVDIEYNDDALPDLTNEDKLQLPSIPKNIIDFQGNLFKAEDIVGSLPHPRDNDFSWLTFIKEFSSNILNEIEEVMLEISINSLDEVNNEIIGQGPSSSVETIWGQLDVLDKWTNYLGITTGVSIIDDVIDPINNGIQIVKTEINNFLASDGIVDITDYIVKGIEEIIHYVRTEVDDVIIEALSDPLILEIDKYYLIAKDLLKWIEIVPWLTLVIGIISLVLLEQSRRGKLKFKALVVTLALIPFIIPGILVIFGKYKTLDEVIDEE